VYLANVFSSLPATIGPDRTGTRYKNRAFKTTYPGKHEFPIYSGIYCQYFFIPLKKTGTKPDSIKGLLSSQGMK